MGGYNEYSNQQTTSNPYQEEIPIDVHETTYKVMPRPRGENAGRNAYSVYANNAALDNQHVRTGSVEFIEKRSDTKG